ncbi:MAG TPA: hypothetical protein VM261_22330 [Kofleriaceae bacterium]|nr:hypothetical protein [Kofleriaceae bacterium]
MLRTVVLIVLASGCAAGFGAPGPGAAGVIRVNGPGMYVDPGCVGWCKARYADGYVKRDGPGLKFMFGTKIGVTSGKLAARERTLGIGSEPHVDLSFVPRSDRWAITATAGYVFQSLTYDADTVAYRGFTPSATLHWGVRRRLYVHGGVGHSFGSIAVTPEGTDDGMSAGAGQHRALAGATLVFRRTPMIDFALRVEANAYTTGEVALGADDGALSGWGVTCQGLLSRF